MKQHGYIVVSTDIIDRGYGCAFTFWKQDFLSYEDTNVECDIITNPPYKLAQEFVEKALDLVEDGRKVAMLLKLTFLEGIKRNKLFKENPPKKVWVFSKRIKCAKNGEFEKYPSSAIAYAWFVWEKGYKGPIILDHID